MIKEIVRLKYLARKNAFRSALAPAATIIALWFFYN